MTLEMFPPKYNIYRFSEASYRAVDLLGLGINPETSTLYRWAVDAEAYFKFKGWWYLFVLDRESKRWGMFYRSRKVPPREINPGAFAAVYWANDDGLHFFNIDEGKPRIDYGPVNRAA